MECKIICKDTALCAIYNILLFSVLKAGRSSITRRACSKVLIVHFNYCTRSKIADNLTKHVFRFVVQCSSNEVQIKRAESKLFYSEVKSFIRDHIHEKWNHHYIAYPAGGQYKFLFPNVQNVPSFQSKEILRLQTAHCCLNQRLLKINCHDTGLCSKCKVPETVPHFLFVCPNYSTDRNILKSAVEKLGLSFDLISILSNKVVYPHLIQYICSSSRCM